MRRKDREVIDIREIREILDIGKTCHLAMVDNGQPYVIPLSYAYEIDGSTLTLFFHSAREGRKLDILHKNNSVCFEISLEGDLIFNEESPCNSGYYFSSVHGLGKAEFIDDSVEKCNILTLLMRHQVKIDLTFKQEQANKVCVYKVVATNFTAKRKMRHTQ